MSDHLMKMADPVSYETNKSLSKRDLELYVPQLIELMNWNCPVESILDYGCGAGSVAYKHLLPLANKMDAKIIGIDISHEMIQHAFNNFTDSRIQFFVGDIMSDNYVEMFQKNSFEKIFSIYVIHFLKDYRTAMKRFYNILKQGGEFGFTVVSTNGFAFNVFRALGEDSTWSNYMEGIQNWIPEWLEPGRNPEFELKSSLEAAGFKIKYLKTNHSIYTGPVETAVDLFVSLNPYLWRIPSHLMEDFREFHRKLLMKLCKSNPEKLPLECDQAYDMIVCVAERH